MTPGAEVKPPTASALLRSVCAAVAGPQPTSSGSACGDTTHRHIGPSLGVNGISAGRWFKRCLHCGQSRYLTDRPSDQQIQLIEQARCIQQETSQAEQTVRNMNKAAQKAAWQGTKTAKKVRTETINSLTSAVTKEFRTKLKERLQVLAASGETDLTCPHVQESLTAAMVAAIMEATKVPSTSRVFPIEQESPSPPPSSLPHQITIDPSFPVRDEDWEFIYGRHPRDGASSSSQIPASSSPPPASRLLSESNIASVGRKRGRSSSVGSDGSSKRRTRHAPEQPTAGNFPKKSSKGKGKAVEPMETIVLSSDDEDIIDLSSP